MTFAVLEFMIPKRASPLSRQIRWPGAASLLIVGTVLGRIILPGGLILVAAWADRAGFGLFNWIDLSPVIAIVASVILLDLLIWAQHLALHHIPLLWPLHRVHHSDPHLDVTTALRFHPLEIVMSLVYKAVIITILGAPPLAVLIFEIALNGFAQFNHANIRLPKKLDQFLRIFVVTPDMHRVHHSVVHSESQTNFGFCLSIWDRIFRTYLAAPELGHEKMSLGQNDWRDARSQRIDKLLWQPALTAEAEKTSASN